MADNSSAVICLNWMELWTKYHWTCSWSQGGVLWSKVPWLAISARCKYPLGAVTGMNGCYEIKPSTKECQWQSECFVVLLVVYPVSCRV